MLDGWDGGLGARMEFALSRFSFFFYLFNSRDWRKFSSRYHNHLSASTVRVSYLFRVCERGGVKRGEKFISITNFLRFFSYFFELFVCFFFFDYFLRFFYVKNLDGKETRKRENRGYHLIKGKGNCLSEKKIKQNEVGRGWVCEGWTT